MMIFDEEGKITPLFKKIIIAASILLVIIILGGYFIITKLLGNKPKVKPIDLEKIQFEAKDNVTFDEFTILLSDNDKKAIAKFKINVEVASTKVKDFLAASVPAVKDNVTRTVMKMTPTEVKQKYASLELHDVIKECLNLLVDKNIKNNKTSDGKFERYNLVVKVNIFDFSVIDID